MDMTARDAFLSSAKGKTAAANLFMPLCYFDYFKSFPDYCDLLDDPNPFTEERIPEELEYRTRFYRSINGVFMDWITIQAYDLELDGSVKLESHGTAEKIVTTYTTPVGDLREVRAMDRAAGTMFVAEPLLKTPRDARTYRYVVESEHVVEHLDEAQKWLDLIGGNGIACQVSGSVPFHAALHQYGPESFLVAAFDMPREVKDLLDALHARSLEIVAVLCRSPFEVVKFESLWDIGILSPDLLAQYYVPTLRDYTDLLHKAGKITMDHLSAQAFRPMMPQLLECGIDFLYGVEVTPENARGLRELSEDLAGRLLMCMGLSAVTLWQEDADAISRMCEAIAGAFSGAHAVFGTSDAMVPGTDPEKLKRAAAALLVG